MSLKKNYTGVTRRENRFPRKIAELGLCCRHYGGGQGGGGRHKHWAGWLLLGFQAPVSKSRRSFTTFSSLSFSHIRGRSSSRKEKETPGLILRPAHAPQTGAQTNPGMVGLTLGPYITHILRPTLCQRLLGLPSSAGETSKQSQKIK